MLHVEYYLIINHFRDLNLQFKLIIKLFVDVDARCLFIYLFLLAPSRS